MIKYVCLTVVMKFLFPSILLAQGNEMTEIKTLIDNYSLARDKKDTILLKQILTSDIDQLVSNGEWRVGIRSAIDGMQRSTASNPGTRTLTLERIRFLDMKHAIADARYEITNTQGITRKMWSSFVVVYRDNRWKISAIRNMLPAGQ